MRQLLVALAFCLLLPRCDRVTGRAGLPEPPGSANQSPAAEIVSPVDLGRFVAGSAIEFRGRGMDPEDGELPPTALTWASDLDGRFGSGTPVTATLSVGTHRITLDAVDADGAHGTSSITVTVGAANLPPVAVIDAPLDGAFYREGQSVSLSGHADDAEDGVLPGSALTWSSSLYGSLGTGRSLTLPSLSLGTHQLLLTAVDSLGASGRATVAVHVVAIGANLPPAARIESPATGATFVVGTAVTFTGSGTDPEDGILTGASLVWASSVDGPLGTGKSIVSSSLTAAVHEISFTVTDTQGASSVATIAVVIHPANNQPPAATITSPADRSVHTAGTSVAFTATATDPEDGVLSGAALVWSSDQDGQLGTGQSLTVATLSAGTHQISLTATDSGGALGIARISVVILPANDPPVATITSPANGSTFTAGDVIEFRGAAVDPQDGALLGTALTWSSDRDGVMDHGNTLAFGSLSAGAHVVTLTVVDAGGLTGSDALAVTIQAAPVNLPPVARLTAPAQAYMGDPVTLYGNDSSDPDGTVVAYAFDFGDGAPPVSGAAATVQHIFAALGKFTVTLTVTDNEAAAGQASATIEILKRPHVPEVVDDRSDVLGSVCDLALDGADQAHIVYRNDTHPGLWYAVWNGAGWTREMVDGMGFDVGARVGSAMAIAVSAAGTPHIAYYYVASASGTNRIGYATKSAAAWTLESVDADATSVTSSQMAIALDPANSLRPTVFYTARVSGYRRPAVSYRTGPGAWTRSVPASAASPDIYFAGGAAFTQTGEAVLAAGNPISVWTWTPAGGLVATSGPAGNSGCATPPWTPLRLNAAGEPLLLHCGGVEHRQGAVWVYSKLEATPLGAYDLALSATGELVVAHEHDAILEVVRSFSGSYWQRDYQGPMDTTQIGVAVDSEAEPHACFFRSGNLMYY